jgi:hypothetical protein
VTYPRSLTVEPEGALFIANNTSPESIFVYRHGKRPSQPTSTITVQDPYFAYSIAASGNYLYAVGRDSVDVYSAFQDGPQAPFFSMALRDAVVVAVGP